MAEGQAKPAKGPDHGAALSTGGYAVQVSRIEDRRIGIDEIELLLLRTIVEGKGSCREAATMIYDVIKESGLRPNP